jgi:serine/threonine protein kinase
LQTLGKGVYSVVKKGVDRITNVEYAIKVIQKSSAFERDELMNEVLSMASIDHPVSHSFCA